MLHYKSNRTVKTDQDDVCTEQKIHRVTDKSLLISFISPSSENMPLVASSTSTS